MRISVGHNNPRSIIHISGAIANGVSGCYRVSKRETAIEHRNAAPANVHEEMEGLGGSHRSLAKRSEHCAGREVHKAGGFLRVGYESAAAFVHSSRLQAESNGRVLNIASTTECNDYLRYCIIIILVHRGCQSRAKDGDRESCVVPRSVAETLQEPVSYLSRYFLLAIPILL